MERIILKLNELRAALKELESWEEAGGKLRRSYKFENFAESLAFVNAVGELAEKADHHPDIKFGWGYAEIELTTHDAGGITAADLSLAQQIDSL